MDKIDLNSIIGDWEDGDQFNIQIVKNMIKEAIHQTLVLASEIDPIYDEQGEVSQDKQSILDIKKLIV